MGLLDRDYKHERWGQQEPKASNWPIVFTVLAVIAVVSGWAQLSSEQPMLQTWLDAMKEPTADPKSAVREEELQFPATGDTRWYVETKGAPMARLEVTAPVGRLNYVLQLKDWESNRPVALIPVRQGSTADVQVPLGRYRLTIMEGTSWYGPPSYFGRSMSANESIHSIDFYKVADGTIGHTISLTGRVNGNLQTRPVRAP